MSCWAVAGLLVAEESNAGVRVFIADITSMCGLGSDRVAALLCACLLVFCCNHRFRVVVNGCLCSVGR